jgi:metal-responsive CopG/Arc/MetJ family transcriptional regulator
MPSKGSPIITVRIPEKLLVEMEIAINRRNLFRQAQFFNKFAPADRVQCRSSFIAGAIREKLRKMERSRRKRPRRRTA